MNLAEIRQKHPQYDDLTDMQIASGLHQKYYSDMDFSDFSQKIGFSPETEIPTTITRQRGLDDIDLAPADLPSRGPKLGMLKSGAEAIARGAVDVPEVGLQFQEQPIKEAVAELRTKDIAPPEFDALPVGEPAVAAKALELSFLPVTEILRSSPVTEAELADAPEMLEKKESSILQLVDLGARGLAEKAFPGGYTAEDAGEALDLNPEFAGQVAQVAVELGVGYLYAGGVIKILGGASEALFASNWWRRMSIPERRLVIQTVEGMQEAGMSEAQILRSLNKQGRTAEFDKFRTEEIIRRQSVDPTGRAPERPIPEPPVEPAPVIETKPIEPIKAPKIVPEAAPIPEPSVVEKAPEIAPVEPVEPVKAKPEPKAKEPVFDAEIGKMMGTGEIATTATGRKTTPYPKIDTTTNRKAINTVKRVDKWLTDNAIAEAKSRGDEFNLLQFEGMDAKKLSPADKSSVNQYLFGEEQPQVPKPILKELKPKPKLARKKSEIEKAAKGKIEPSEFAEMVKEGVRIERRSFFGIRDKVDRGLMTKEAARAGEKPDVTIHESRLNANAADLAADYKARGIETNAAYSQFVRDRALKPEMDAKEFINIYNSVTPKLFEPKKPKLAKPTKPEIEVTIKGEEVEFIVTSEGLVPGSWGVRNVATDEFVKIIGGRKPAIIEKNKKTLQKLADQLNSGEKEYVRTATGPAGVAIKEVVTKPKLKLKKSEIEITGTKEKEVSVDIPKTEADALTPKEQKAYLMAEIDTVITKEVEASGFSGTIEEAEGIGFNVLGESTGFYKFEVPGDGTFEVVGSQLFQFKKRVKSIFPATTPKPFKLKKFGKPKARKRRVSELNLYNEILSRKKPGDLKPTDVDALLKSATELGDYEGFINYLLEQDLKPETLKKIRRSFLEKDFELEVKKDQLKDAKEELKTTEIDSIRSELEQEIQSLTDEISAKEPTPTPPGKAETFASVDITQIPEAKIPEAPKGKPILTEGQKTRRLKAKEVKEKQINIEDAKEAKEQIRLFIIRRRKALNLSAYETNLFVNDIEKVTTKTQREVIPFIIEGTDIPKELKNPALEKAYEKHKDELKPIAKQVKKHFNKGWQKMKKHIPDMSAKQVEDYVTHIWDLNKTQKREVTNWFITQNRFLKKRYVATLKEGIDKFGLKPRTLDIGEIIRIHDGVMNRAIENKKFVDDLMQLRHDGIPLIERADKAPHEWILYDHPALRKALVIPGDPKMGEKISPQLKAILDDMGVAIGRRISPVAFGKPTRKIGEYKAGEPPEVRFQRFMSNKTIAHEIGHHLDVTLELGDEFLNNYKSELYAINRDRIELSKKDPGKYGIKYTSSTAEQIAEFFATLFTDAGKAYRIAPNATIDVLERLKQDGTLSKLVDFDFEKSAKNLIEEQLNLLVKLPVKVHPDIKKPMDVIFGSRHDSDVIRAYEMVNGILKKSILSLSLFHHAALGETGIATMGIARTAKIYFNPVKIYRAIAKGELDIYKKEAIARKWIGAGLQVGATKDIPVHMIQDKLNALARKTKSIPIANKATQFIATFNQVWDKALWDYLHDTLKLYAAEHLGTHIDAFKDIDKQMEEIAQFVNDTFGGQNWDMLMLNPKQVQYMTWGLLSADWTTSTIRQALSPTGIGAIHKETKGLRKKLGRYFWVKAGLYFGVGINMLNYTFRKWDEKKNPQYYKGQKMTFMDRTMFGNVIGKKTNLFVGRYEDGTERYIRWGKQFRELPELFWDDTGFSPISATLKKAGGKLAPAIQLASRIGPGVSPSGFRNDDVYGKKGWDRTFGIFKTIIKSPIPFASRNLLSKDKKFHITDVAFPSSKGMTRYRSIEFFKHAILKKDERILKETYQDTLKNNLPAFTLFNAALTSLKAETTRELNKSRKTIKDLEAALKTTRDREDAARILRRMIRFKKEARDRDIGIKAYGIALEKMKLYNADKQEPKNPKLNQTITGRSP